MCLIHFALRNVHFVRVSCRHIFYNFQDFFLFFFPKEENNTFQFSIRCNFHLYISKSMLQSINKNNITLLSIHSHVFHRKLLKSIGTWNYFQAETILLGLKGISRHTFQSFHRLYVLKSQSHLQSCNGTSNSFYNKN